MVKRFVLALAITMIASPVLAGRQDEINLGGILILYARYCVKLNVSPPLLSDKSAVVDGLEIKYSNDKTFFKQVDKYVAQQTSAMEDPETRKLWCNHVYASARGKHRWHFLTA
jgi:hypothetical protein